MSEKINAIELLDEIKGRDYETSIDGIKADIKRVLPKEKFEHSVAVMEEVTKYADRLHIDSKDIALAGLLHDVTKNLRDEAQLKFAFANKIIINGYNSKDAGISNEELYKYTAYNDIDSSSYHGITATIIARAYGLTNETVLTAMTRHTSAAKDMSIYDKILFLSDVTDSTRTYDEVKLLRHIANEDFEKGVLAAYNHIIVYRIQENKKVSVDLLRARNKQRKITSINLKDYEGITL